MKNFKIFYRQILEEIKDVQRYIDTVDNDDVAYYFYIKDKENDSDIIKIGINVTKESLKDMSEEMLKKQISSGVIKMGKEFNRIGMSNNMKEVAEEILDHFNKNMKNILS